MDENILENLETVADFIENVGRHGRVEVVHRPYQRKDEGPRSGTVHLAYHLFITPIRIILHILLVIFLFISPFLLIILFLFLPFFFLFLFTLLFLLSRGVSRWVPL